MPWSHSLPASKADTGHSARPLSKRDLAWSPAHSTPGSCPPPLHKWKPTCQPWLGKTSMKAENGGKNKKLTREQGFILWTRQSLSVPSLTTQGRCGGSERQARLKLLRMASQGPTNWIRTRKDPDLRSPPAYILAPSNQRVLLVHTWADTYQPAMSPCFLKEMNRACTPREPAGEGQDGS